MFTTAGAARWTASAYVRAGLCRLTRGAAAGGGAAAAGGRTRSGRSATIRNARASPPITDPATSARPRPQLFIAISYRDFQTSEGSPGSAFSFVYNAPPPAGRKLQSRAQTCSARRVRAGNGWVRQQSGRATLDGG